MNTIAFILLANRQEIRIKPKNNVIARLPFTPEAITTYKGIFTVFLKNSLKAVFSIIDVNMCAS